MIEIIRQFLRPAEESGLKLWNADFFKAKLTKMITALA